MRLLEKMFDPATGKHNVTSHLALLSTTLKLENIPERVDQMTFPAIAIRVTFHLRMFLRALKGKFWKRHQTLMSKKQLK